MIIEEQDTLRPFALFKGVVHVFGGLLIEFKEIKGMEVGQHPDLNYLIANELVGQSPLLAIHHQGITLLPNTEKLLIFGVTL